MTINKMDTQGYWMVNSNHIYIPSTPCEIEHSNVVGPASGRDQSGVMRIDWLRRDVRKVLLKYKAITDSELEYMMSKMQGKEFSFTFLDRGVTQTFNGYVGESKYEFYSYSSAYDEGVYINFEIHVIEK